MVSDRLVPVEQAAERAPKNRTPLHPRRATASNTGGEVLSYRSRQLDAFAGIASCGSEAATADAQTTCIVDIPDASVAGAERMATFLHSPAMDGNVDTPPLHLEKAFEPRARSLKVAVIGSPSDVGKLLEMLQLQLGARS